MKAEEQVSQRFLEVDPLGIAVPAAPASHNTTNTRCVEHARLKVTWLQHKVKDETTVLDIYNLARPS